MGAHARQRPKHLGAKLLAIRRNLGASQSEMEMLLDFQVNSARISEYEHSKREPNLLVLLSYARLVAVPVDTLIDDSVKLSL
jgi:transcriptional regulator with XRE-family HTH domain